MCYQTTEAQLMFEQRVRGKKQKWEYMRDKHWLFGPTIHILMTQ